jgi:hypothetical protein
MLHSQRGEESYQGIPHFRDSGNPRFCIKGGNNFFISSYQIHFCWTIKKVFKAFKIPVPESDPNMFIFLITVTEGKGKIIKKAWTVFSFNVPENTQSFPLQKETPEIPVGFVIGEKIRNADSSEIFPSARYLKKNCAISIERKDRGYSGRPEPVFKGSIDDMLQGSLAGLPYRVGYQRYRQYRSYTP